MTLEGPTRSGGTVGRFMSNYAMLAVLVLLCAFFSWVTVQEQERSGTDAAAVLARDLEGAAPPPARVLIVARPGE